LQLFLKRLLPNLKSSFLDALEGLVLNLVAIFEELKFFWMDHQKYSCKAYKKG
jgi:hypothetical protein